MSSLIQKRCNCSSLNQKLMQVMVNKHCLVEMQHLFCSRELDSSHFLERDAVIPRRILELVFVMSRQKTEIAER